MRKSFCVSFLWNICWTMAAGQSPPGRPGITIMPLKPDKEVAGWGRQFWLKKDDSK